MFTRFNLRDVLVWLVLAASVVLLSISFTFAQSTTINRNNGKVHIKVIDKSGPNAINLDTTFTANSDEDFEKAMDAINKKYDLNVSGGKMHKEIKKGKNSGKIRYDITIKDDDKKDGKVIRKKGEIDLDQSMAEFEKAMEELEKTMQNMDINISFNDNGEDFVFDLNSSRPEDCNKEKKICKEKKIIRSYNDDGFEIPDSLDDENHVIVFGDDEEPAPVLEKTITTPNGKKVFIYKRAIPAVKEGESSIQELNVFPNPAKDQVSVSFKVPMQSDVEVSVSEESGKTVYKLMMDGYNGEFNHTFDLSDKKKGTYIIKVSVGNERQSRKVVVN